MSNPNPDTSGLRPFNTMPRSESAMIQSAGGIARAEKMRQLKTIKEIVQGLRADAPIDPIETAVANLFSKLTDSDISPNDTMKVINALYKIIGEQPTDWTSFERQAPRPAYDPAEIAKIHHEIVKLSQEEERKARARGEIQ